MGKISMKKPDVLIILYPLMELDKVIELTYGKLGPAQLLLDFYPQLSEIIKGLQRYKVDEIILENPVIAITKSNFKKFNAELEIVAFLAIDHMYNPAADEIYSQKVDFICYTEDDKTLVYIDKYAIVDINSMCGIIVPSYPKSYFKWDKESIKGHQEQLNHINTDEWYNGIKTYLLGDGDKEEIKEKNRIITSLYLYNQSKINHSFLTPFSKNRVIYLAAALEALLNLPTENIGSAFYLACSTLLGKSSLILKKWCQEFYKYRSEIVHGSSDWVEDEQDFIYLDKPIQSHSKIAEDIYVECLKSKLILRNLISHEQKYKFDFENYNK
jgi:hypothetical protein